MSSFSRLFLQILDKQASGHEMLVPSFGTDSVKCVDERTRVVKKQVEMCKEKEETNEKMLCNSFKTPDDAKYEYDCEKKYSNCMQNPCKGRKCCREGCK